MNDEFIGSLIAKKHMEQKIGHVSDPPTAGSVMGGLNKVNQNIDAIDTKIGTPDDATAIGLSSTIMGKLNSVLNSAKSGQIIWPSCEIESPCIVQNKSFEINAKSYFFIAGDSTMSGKDELHVFNNDRIHLIWDGDVFEQQLPPPRSLSESAGTVSGYRGSKRIHFLGGEVGTSPNDNSVRHDYYNVKTRAWERVMDLPGQMVAGACCGELMNGIGTPVDMNDIYFVNIEKGVHCWSGDTMEYSILFGADLSFGGGYSLAAHKDGYLLICKQMSWKIYNIKDGRPKTLPALFENNEMYCSFGAISAVAPASTKTERLPELPSYSPNKLYCFNGGSLSEYMGKFVTTTMKNSFHFIKNNTVHFVTSDLKIYILQHGYSVYLPQGTKLYNAHNFKSSDLLGVKEHDICFPQLRIDGDAFVVDKGGMVTYCSQSSGINLNTNMLKDGTTISTGIYVLYDASTNIAK